MGLQNRLRRFESVHRCQGSLIMRAWRNGCASASQAEDTGSTPVARSIRPHVGMTAGRYERLSGGSSPSGGTNLLANAAGVYIGL